MIREFAYWSRNSLYDHIAANRVNLVLHKPVFSITFDDVPVSGYSIGSNLLEDNGIYGTYYVSLGLATAEKSRFEPRPPGKVYFIDEHEILALHNAGHHIACHTYSHNHPSSIKLSDYLEDAYNNRKLLSTIIPDLSVDHFAYPYGKVTLGVKKELKSIYKTMRTTIGGVNHGVIDLCHLRSNQIYSSCFDKNKLSQLIQHNIANNGWLIFHTHDVEDKCSEWGTTPDDFKWLIDRLLITGGDILNVRDTYKKITSLYIP